MMIRKLAMGEEPPMKLLLDADPSISHVMEYLHKGECYIAEEGSTIMGVYVLLPNKSQTIELVNIAVAEEYQGKGLGKQLLLDAIGKARAGGYNLLEVCTGNSSIGQLAFYQKGGFRMMSIEHDYFVKNYSEEIYENGILCRDRIRLAKEL